ncbi:MAG: hypothetical protein J7530_06990 [Novosphingobium sp.]|nr:hypothetical protein [Novosphingobium sp.]
MNRLHTLSLVTAALALSPLPAIAQGAAQANRPEAGNPEQQRKALNEEQARAARAQVEDNVAREQARQATIATEAARRQREESAYNEAVRSHEAAVRDYDAAHAQWEASNPYCKRNDPVKCPR